MQVVETQRMRLVPCGPDHIRKLIEGPDAFEVAYGLRVAGGWLEWPEVLPWFLDMAERYDGTKEAEWNLMRLCVLKAQPILMGGCGFKGSPDADGAVEIGYGIARAYRGQGYATEASGALVEIGRRSSRVRSVRACTPPEESASASVLRRCGFEFVGEGLEPSEGMVWQWRIAW